MKSHGLMMLAAAMIAFAGCKKDKGDDNSGNNNGGGDTYPTTKNALFLYYSGSECNPCGSLGIPNYNNVLTQNANKVVPIVVHCNAPAPDSLYESQVGGELLSLIVSGGSYSAPTYLIPPNAKFSGSASNAVTTANGYIQTFTSGAPDASSFIKGSVSGNTLNVTAKTKFLKAVSGNYKVAVYVLEDGVVFRQLVNGSYVNPFTHDDVLRARMSASAYGDELVSGNATEGQIVEKTYTMSLPASSLPKLKQWNPANLSIVAVVWKHTPQAGGGTLVEVVNAQQIDL